MLYGDRMKRFVEGLDRGQTTLFPRHVEDWIEEDNPVRVVDFFVDELDLGLLGFDGADIGYIWTAEGWLTLAIVLDLYFRRIVGWATSDRLKKELALTALERAIAVRGPSTGLIHQSDRGSQYCADDD